jgi:hypothetical protein
VLRAVLGGDRHSVVLAGDFGYSECAVTPR